MFLYHTTNKKNLDSILMSGIVSSGLGIVYLSEKPDSWWKGDEYVTLEIDMDKVDHKLTTFGEKDLDEVLCWGDIPADSISIYNGRNAVDKR